MLLKKRRDLRGKDFGRYRHSTEGFKKALAPNPLLENTKKIEIHTTWQR